MTKMKIEMIHDLMCSWCPIGYSNLSKALEQLRGTIEVELQFLPFQLNPDMAFDGEDINKHLARRVGKSTAELAEYRRTLLEVANAADVIFNFNKRTHYYNSFKAHALMNAAQHKGLQLTALKLFHKAYFEDGRNLADKHVLADITKQIDNEDLLDVALTQSNQLETKAKEARARALGVRSIPTFIVNDTHMIQGSNSVDYFLELLPGLSQAA